MPPGTRSPARTQEECHARTRFARELSRVVRTALAMNATAVVEYGYTNTSTGEFVVFGRRDMAEPLAKVFNRKLEQRWVIYGKPQLCEVAPESGDEQREAAGQAIEHRVGVYIDRVDGRDAWWAECSCGWREEDRNRRSKAANDGGWHLDDVGLIHIDDRWRAEHAQ